MSTPTPEPSNGEVTRPHPAQDELLYGVAERVAHISSLLRETGVPMHSPQLLFRDPQGLVRSVELKGPLVLGRGAECDLQLEHPQVSRRHCLVEPCEDGIHLQDLGSSNGTLLNGRRITEAIAGAGDLLELGSSALRIALV